jgi:hypothetical protein
MNSVSFRADLNAERVLWLVVAETLFDLDATVRTLDLEERWFFDLDIQRASYLLIVFLFVSFEIKSTYS